MEKAADHECLHENVLRDSKISIIIIDKNHIKIFCNVCFFAFGSGLRDILQTIRQHFARTDNHDNSFFARELPTNIREALEHYDKTLFLPFAPILDSQIGSSM